MLTNRYPNARQSAVIKEFETYLLQFFTDTPHICEFEEWMLG